MYILKRYPNSFVGKGKHNNKSRQKRHTCVESMFMIRLRGGAVREAGARLSV